MGAKMEQGMRSSSPVPTNNPFKAIFAITEVCQVFEEGKVYQSRGMACAVRSVKGSIRLVTWNGVIGKSDCNKEIYMDRFSENSFFLFFKDTTRYRYEKPTIKEIKENGTFSFLSVDCSKEANVYTKLDLKVPESDTKTSDLTAFSFSGKQPLELTFKYEESKKKHELVAVTGDDGKKLKSTLMLEKSNILGSPIMVNQVDRDGRKNYSVVGVVGEIDGELSPCFITETELGQGRNQKEGLNGNSSHDGQSSSGTDELDALFGVKTGDLINDETNQNAIRANLMKNLSSKNLVIDEVAGDGNCFFRAVARQLCKHITRYKKTVGEYCTSLGLGRGEDEDTRELRQLFVMELRENIDEYKKCLTSGNDMLKEIEKFEANGYFASKVGDLCPTATAKLLRIPIVIVTAHQTKPTMEFAHQDLTTTPPIVLAHDHSEPEHYDATKYNESQSSDENIQKDIPAETRYTCESQSSDENIQKDIPAETRYTCDKGRNLKDDLNGNSPQDGQSSSGTKETDAKFGSVTEFSEKVRSGVIPLTSLPYLALDILADGDWRSVGRSLGLGVGHLNGIERDCDEEYERYYKVLRIYHRSDNASYKVLADVLKEHGLHSIRAHYCLEEHDPPTKKPPVDLGNLKLGRVDDKPLQYIASAVEAECKKLGRALGVTDDELDRIVKRYPQEMSEQSYQILRKWREKNGRESTYNALAQALHDRTVNMGKIATKFCLA